MDTNQPQSEPFSASAAKSSLLPRVDISSLLMFIYMTSVFIKFPVFQQLVFEKSCLVQFGAAELLPKNIGDGFTTGHHFTNASTICNNISAVHANVNIQHSANRVLFFSTIALLAPAAISSLVLGSLLDTSSIIRPRHVLSIPFIGLLISDLNAIIQSIRIDASAYWLLIGDSLFGLAGGFTSIIGLLFAYSVRRSPNPQYRSIRVATLEGSIGLGTMLGSFLSGQLRVRFGYAFVFAAGGLLDALVLASILLWLPNFEEIQQHEGQQIDSHADYTICPVSTASVEHTNNVETVLGHFKSAVSTHFRHIAEAVSIWLLWTPSTTSTSEASVGPSQALARRRTTVRIVLLSIAATFFSVSGVRSILFSFFRFQLQWTDKEYGWFRALDSAGSSLMVLVVYPAVVRCRVGSAPVNNQDGETSSHPTQMTSSPTEREAPSSLSSPPPPGSPSPLLAMQDHGEGVDESGPRRRIELDFQAGQSTARRAIETNAQLALVGLISKCAALVLFAFAAHTTLLAMLVALPRAFGRFASTGLRAIASSAVPKADQGKLFALIALVQSGFTLAGSMVLTGLFPYTLPTWPWACMAGASVVLVLFAIGPIVWKLPLWPTLCCSPSSSLAGCPSVNNLHTYRSLTTDISEATRTPIPGSNNSSVV